MLWLRQQHILIITIAIVISIFFIDMIGIFQISNRVLYDKLTPFISIFHQNHYKYLLVDSSYMSEKDINSSIDLLMKKDIKFIVADIFHPFVKDSKKIQNIQASDKIIAIAPYSYNLDEANITRYPLYEKIPYANYKDIAKSFDKIYSDRYFNYNINYNNFRTIPSIYGYALLKGHIPDDFFKNRIIIISNFDNRYANTQLSPFESKYFLHQNYLSYMIESAIKKSWIISLKGWLNYALIFIYLITVLIIFYTGSEMLESLILIVAISTIALYIFLISILNFALPVSELMFALASLSLYILRFWERSIKEKEHRLIRTLSNSLSNQKVYRSFFNSQDYWDEISSLIKELFTLNKSMFLSKQEQSVHLKEVYAINCSFDDIYERRRDYNREPYQSAIKYRKAMQINRKFFKNTTDNEIEYIVALTHFNTIVGFWVFSIYKKDIHKIEVFESDITDCSREISRLLFERDRFIKQRTQKKESFTNRIKHFLELDIRNANISKIESNFTILLKQMYIKNIINNNIHSDIVLYDFFGRIISTNEQMSQLLKKEDIDLYSLNATKFLMQITDIPKKLATDIIRNTIYHKISHENIVCLKNTKKRFLLSLHPITKEQIEKYITENYFMDVYGIIFEFIDLDFVETIRPPDDEFIRGFIKYNKPNIKNLKNIHNKTVNETDCLDSFYRSIPFIEQIYKSCREMEYILDNRCQDMRKYGYPLNLITIIESSINNFEKEFNTKNITIDRKNLKHIAIYFKIGAKKFYEYMKIFLIYLSEDCEDGGNIQISTDELDDTLIITMKSSGYGMPQEQLEAYLKKQHIISFDEIKHILKHYDMDIEIKSGIGEGITILLSFKPLEAVKLSEDI